MQVVQVLAIVISLGIAAVGTALFVRAIGQIVATMRIGQPAHRLDRPGTRAVTLVRETLGHTRMLQWTWVGAAHWFIMVGFGLLFLTLVQAFGQLFSPTFVIPLVGHFPPFEWLTELFAWVMTIAIVGFIAYRATRPTERVRGERGRFFGSTMWQGYFVELVILGVGLCIIALRALEYALAVVEGSEYASLLHFPLTAWIGSLFTGASEAALGLAIILVATAKILISFTWMIVISLRPTMGVAWHRFLAFFNIYLKRDADGRTALGGLKPMTSGGEPVDFEDLEEMDEDTKLGVGAIEDFSWKGILDFTTCTECGRCQSQCPAWNTDKPLSPKMLILQLRDHAHAKAPYLLADESARADLPAATLAEAERPLVGATEGDWAWNPTGGAVIDDDVLWSCTSCGACVQQCPVDIEHVDHILDMRRHQVLVESNFPAELNGLFKGLENKGNPWNMSPKARLDWAKDLPFEVKVVGEDVESLDEVEWLFWVGCAGAYEDRAKKTTRAVAELLDMAGVDFAVLGNGETCTGDPARRAGNEFVFAGLAAQNAETLKETKAKKVVSTCAHCFNTLKNEYAAFGVELEVVHHTQLLNRLVREKRLTPVATNGGPKRQVTYHDPCYIGRHNGVYSPPRELLTVIPDAELTEMPRNSERSFCCGAGGARMWMEENVGERINMNRTQEAVDTGAQQIAVGCPFCRVMLSDGLTMKQSKGEASEDVEVLDVAQMLLASIKGESSAPVRGDAERVPAGASAKAGAVAGAGAAAGSVATQADPETDDVTRTSETLTETSSFGAGTSGGAAASASNGGSGGSGSSLFDLGGDDAGSTDASGSPETGADHDPEPTRPDDAAPPSGGSLFDLGEDSSDDQPTAAVKAADRETPALGGGSLFDLGDGDDATDDATEASSDSRDAAPAPAPSGAGPASEIPSGGSLFDIAEPEETPTQTAAAPAPADPAPADPTPADPTPAAASPASEIPSGGSLFDIAEPEEAPAPAAPAASAPTEVTQGEPAADQALATPEPAPVADSGSSTKRYPAGRSMFDLPTTQTRETPSTTPASAASSGDAPAAGSATSLKDIKARYSGGGTAAAASPEPAEADPTATPGDAPEAESESESVAAPEAEETPQQEPTRPVGSGEAHTPRTDAEIPDSAEGGSLFDL